MTNSSYIATYISEHPDTWVGDFLDIKIKVKQTKNLAIFNYYIDADFYNPVVQEARGIIIDMDTLDVVCWPFRKFGNYGEGYADKIDWETARVQDKIDGSIMKLYYYNGRWNWATNGNIDAGDAPLSTMDNKSFLDLIKEAVNYKDLRFDDLQKDTTYIFELASPCSQIVISYPETKLYHIGTRKNNTGEEIACDIGIEKPEEYKIGSLEECVRAAEHLNAEKVEKEGFVVVDGSCNRIKVKSLDYVAMHHMRANRSFKKEHIVNLLLSGNKDEVLKQFPDMEGVLAFYSYEIARTRQNFQTIIDGSFDLWEELEHDKKAFALTVKDSAYAPIAFCCTKENASNESVLQAAMDKLLLNFIRDYEPPSFAKLLTKRKEK